MSRRSLSYGVVDFLMDHLTAREKTEFREPPLAEYPPEPGGIDIRPSLANFLRPDPADLPPQSQMQMQYRDELVEHFPFGIYEPFSDPDDVLIRGRQYMEHVMPNVDSPTIDLNDDGSDQYMEHVMPNVDSPTIDLNDDGSDQEEAQRQSPLPDWMYAMPEPAPELVEPPPIEDSAEDNTPAPLMVLHDIPPLASSFRVNNNRINANTLPYLVTSGTLHLLMILASPLCNMFQHYVQIHRSMPRAPSNLISWLLLVFQTSDSNTRMSALLRCEKALKPPEMETNRRYVDNIPPDLRIGQAFIRLYSKLNETLFNYLPDTIDLTDEAEHSATLDALATTMLPFVFRGTSRDGAVYRYVMQVVDLSRQPDGPIDVFMGDSVPLHPPEVQIDSVKWPFVLVVNFDHANLRNRHFTLPVNAANNYILFAFITCSETSIIRSNEKRSVWTSHILSPSYDRWDSFDGITTGMDVFGKAQSYLDNMRSTMLNRVIYAFYYHAAIQQ